MAANGKKIRWAEVSCDQHGVHDPDRHWMRKQVAVSVPENKKDSVSGCPLCRKVASRG